MQGSVVAWVEPWERSHGKSDSLDDARCDSLGEIVVLVALVHDATAWTLGRRRWTATLLAANAASAPLNKPACPVSPTQRPTPQPGRMQGCIALSILLNVAALCAAISVGAMQLLDPGARPRIIAPLCLLSCAVTM
eukprot:4423099-Pleurochrysis_carterae.AAC.1